MEIGCKAKFFFEKIVEEKVAVWALILTVLLLVTSSPAPEKGGDGGTLLPAQTELNRMISAPSVPAALFRGLTIIFLTLAVAGVVLNIRGIIGRDWQIFPSGIPPAANWGIWPVVKLIIFFLCIFLSFQRLERFLVDIFGIYRAGFYHQLFLLNAFIQFSLLIILMVLFLRKVTPAAGNIWNLGVVELTGDRWRLRARQAARGYILFFPGLIILVVASLVITRIAGLPYQPHPLVQPLLEAGKASLIWQLFAIGILLGPLAEELFFRGLLFPALKRKVGVFWSILISAALFSTLHLNWLGWMPIFGLGVLLAYSYEKTGSLLVPVFIHVIHNTLFLTLAVLVFELRA